MSQPTRAGIVIIGGGQAGGWAAKTLRDRGYNGRLSVISDEPYDFYERPPLSKAALLDGSAPLSRLFSEEVVAGMNIDWHRPLRAEAIDGQQQIVTLSDGSQLQFDQLLIATGGRPRLPDASWAKHPRVMTLRSWDDAARLRQGLQQCQKLAIVGGGWIGLEIAASARKLGVDVTVFERQPALCMRSVGPAFPRRCWNCINSKASPCIATAARSRLKIAMVKPGLAVPAVPRSPSTWWLSVSVLS